MHAKLREFTCAAWDELELPKEIPEQGLPDTNTLNYFMPDEAWFQRRLSPLEKAREALDLCAEGHPVPGKVSPGRWVPGLKKLASDSTEDLRSLMQGYMAAVAAAKP